MSHATAASVSASATTTSSAGSDGIPPLALPSLELCRESCPAPSPVPPCSGVVAEPTPWASLWTETEKLDGLPLVLQGALGRGDERKLAIYCEPAPCCVERATMTLSNGITTIPLSEGRRPGPLDCKGLSGHAACCPLPEDGKTIVVRGRLRHRGTGSATRYWLDVEGVCAPQ